MPIQPDPQHVQMLPHQVQIPVTEETHMFLSLQIQNDGQATMEAMDEVLQSLVDHLQTWPGRHPTADVSGQKYDTLLYIATPTDPIVP
jgi:hypothetical protein